MESDWVTFSPAHIDTPPSNYIINNQSIASTNQNGSSSNLNDDFLHQFNDSGNSTSSNNGNVNSNMNGNMNSNINEGWNDLENIDFLNPNNDSNNNLNFDYNMNNDMQHSIDINLENSSGNDNSSNSHINIKNSGGNHQANSSSNGTSNIPNNNIDFDGNSTAFPPLNQSIIPPTPNSLEMLSHSNTFFQSPVLLSQNKNMSSNNIATNIQQNPSHKSSDSIQYQQQKHQQHVRPDVIFTPLVSPAVTPLDSQLNVNKSGTPALQTFFSPLTSPALEAKKRLSPDELSSVSQQIPSLDKRKSSFSSSTYKRRTPHNTPIMSASKNGRIVKQSPVIKSRKSSTVINNNNNKLPDSSVDYKTTKSTDSPPQTYQAPSSMMNFTLGKLQQQQSSSSNIALPDLAAAPTSMPKNHSAILPKTTQQQSPILLSQTNSAKSNIAPTSTTNYSNLVNVAFNMKYQNNTSTFNIKEESDSNNKKNSHKIAEKGRRNRMNIAIQELSSLIPQFLHDEVTIPSKATTVELGCKFIKILLDEIESLKSKKSPSNNGNDDGGSDESISPLEFEK